MHSAVNSILMKYNYLKNDLSKPICVYLLSGKIGQVVNEV